VQMRYTILVLPGKNKTLPQQRGEKWKLKMSFVFGMNGIPSSDFDRKRKNNKLQHTGLYGRYCPSHMTLVSK